MAENQFYVPPPNVFQALMAGQQAYTAGQKQQKETAMQAGRMEAVQALQSGGDPRSALAKLIGIGDVKGAEAIANYAKTQADQAWRVDEANRAQQNADRSYGLQEKSTNASLANAAATRSLAERQFQANLEGQKVPQGFTRSPEGGLMPIPNGPADPNYIERVNGVKNNSIPQEVNQRRQAVLAQGLDPNQPANMAFILSGRMPREDQQPLTATDKKAIMEADEGVMAADNAITSMKKAIDLSGKAYEGPTAGIRGTVTGLFGSEEGRNTTLLTNEVMASGLAQMKSIFGGNPTEGERKVLLDIQGSASQPHAVRKEIYERGLALAQRRLEFNKQRAGEMRGGSYYKPQGGSAAGSSGLLSEAKAALAAGADRDAVIQRLRGMGVDPSGL